MKAFLLHHLSFILSLLHFTAPFPISLAVMTDEPLPPPSFALTAAIFEGSLAIVAVSLGWLFDVGPLETLNWTAEGALWGTAGVLPPLALLAFCLVAPWRSIRSLRRVVERLLVPLFQHLSVVELAVISILAGVGEEMLFRGVLQATMAGWLEGTPGVIVALAAASLLFGFAHAITPAYLVLATLIGAYLGGLWLWTGNLLAPIIAHAAYDFIALWYLAKVRRPKEPSEAT